MKVLFTKSNARLMRHGLLMMACSLFIAVSSCKKTDDFEVLRPPAQSITFSDVSDLIIDSSGKTITVRAKVAASQGLDKIEIIYQPWNLNKVISTFTSANAHTLAESITIPVSAALQLHSLTIKATDKKGQSEIVDVKIGLQDLNYNKLYLADIEDPAALTADLFGVPMVMDKVGAHTYSVTYYNRNDNTKIRFVPNKNSFTPVAIGLDPNNNQKLITNAATSKPIILPSKGYYKITVNTLLLSYTVAATAATGTAPAQVAIAGRGFADFPTMNWSNVLPNIILLDKDPANPFMFTKMVRIGIPIGQTYTSAQFILTTNNGWTNFWRFDNAADPELAVYNGGTNIDFPITATPVSYMVVFDASTSRIQLIRQ